MIRTKINMIPGIDWTKETLVLNSTSGVEHCAVPEEKYTANYVKVDQQWGGGGYSIVDCGDYLSVKFYHVDGNFSRVKDFKQNIANGDHIGLIPAYSYYKYTFSTESILDTDAELRIYKDRKIVLLHKVIIDDKTLYYVDVDSRNWWKVKSWSADIDINDKNTKIFLQDKNIHKVHNDEEIKALAHKLTKTEHRELHNRLYSDCWSDLNDRHIRSYNSYECGHFTRKTQQEVHNFFDYSGEENGFLRSAFEKVYGSYINSLEKLFTWCYLRKIPTTQAATKEEQAKTLLTDADLMDEWNHPELHSQEAIWARHEDDIILILPRTEDNYLKKIFSYNIKTKKRFYGEQDTNGTWTFPIPGLHYITNSLFLGTSQKYNCKAKTDEEQYLYFPTKTTIKNGLTTRQLFDGTNIAWIIDNTSGECKILNYDDGNVNYRYSGWRETKENVPVDVRNYLSDTKIGSIALSILITTGIPMLEQLLKSKLFNMYFTAVEDLEDRCSSNTIEEFYDLDKKRKYSWGNPYASFTYHSKEKNLKKMFGLSVNLLRKIDDKMVYVYKQNQYNNCYYWKRSIPRIAGMQEALNVDLSTLDSNTFEKCLELSDPDLHTGFTRYGANSRLSNWNAFGEIISYSLGKNASPKQSLALLEEYKDYLGEYRDYLVMRHQLKKVQEDKPDIPDIFSEKHYPMKPGAAKRFIPFLHGMPDTAHPWTRNIFSEESFIEHYQYIYKKADKRGELKVIRDEKTQELLGLFITFTPVENFKYLHDEASYWIAFYQDMGKECAFKEAVKRVEPLEWTDDKSGLCILAPKGIQDIKNEGSVLSHCVASYIDPIINGTENIMLLRRIDMINSPFYTVEVLDNGEIRQVHCYRNGNLTKLGQREAYKASNYEVYDHDFDIIQFLLDWAKAKKGKIKASSIHSAYSALCALR